MRLKINSVSWRMWTTAILFMGMAALTLLKTASAEDQDMALKLRSSTFTNGGTLPLITIFNNPGAIGATSCTSNGAQGGNESPELSWTHAPEDTKTFVVIMYDATASFTHWGMYNIPASNNSLPVNAGVPGSSFGIQIGNDFGDVNYDGPCPPPNLTPTVHQYVITLYALDTELHLGQGIFRDHAGADGLFHGLLEASHHGHLLASASITGVFSSAPTK